MVRRATECLFDRAPDLLELVHQRDLRMKASCGVGDHDVHAGVFGFLNRVEDHRAGVGAVLAFDDLAADAAAPHLELRDGCCAERVTCSQ